MAKTKQKTATIILLVMLIPSVLGISAKQRTGVSMDVEITVKRHWKNFLVLQWRDLKDNPVKYLNQVTDPRPPEIKKRYVG